MRKNKQIILEYLEEEHLVEAYADFLDVSVKDLRYRLKAESKVKNMEYAALYAFRGITPEDLGISNANIDFSQNNLNKNKTVFKCFSDWVKRGNKKIDFTQNYFGAVLDKVERAEKQILIYNYFVNANDISAREEIRKFYGGYLNYFKQLEVQVRDKGLTYKRMLSLPLNQELKYEDKTEYIRQSIFKLFDASYGHILRAFELEDFELYVLPMPRRNFSYVLIDEAYIISEYYRIRKKGIAVPDILFIEEVDKGDENIPARLHRVYDNEFNDLISDQEAIKVSKDLFIHCTKELLELKEKEVARKKEEKLVSSTERIALEKLEEELKKIERKFNMSKQLCG